MPIYEYRCKSCGRTVEVIQKFDDPPLTKCEVCAGPLEKLVSKAAFLLKGGGWFQQDYSKKSSSTSKDSGSDSGDSKKDGSKGESSGDGGKKASGGGCGSGSCGCAH